jgi:hypothetical protein
MTLAAFLVVYDQSKSTDLHRRTVLLLRRMIELKLEPVGCQLPVCCPDTRVGTFVDVVCWDLHKRVYVLLEVKSGYASSDYKASSGRLARPFQEYNDSPYHQHHLQLLATTILFKHTFGCESKEVSGRVLRVDDHKCEALEPPAWITYAEPTVAAVLLVPVPRFATTKQRRRQQQKQQQRRTRALA